MRAICHELHVVALSPDGGFLAVAVGSRGKAKCWGDRLRHAIAEAGRLAARLSPGMPGASLQPGRRTLAVAAGFGGVAQLRLFDARTRDTSRRSPSSRASTTSLTGGTRRTPLMGGCSRRSSRVQAMGTGREWLLVLRDPATGDPGGSPLHAGEASFSSRSRPMGARSSRRTRGSYVAIVQWDLETRRGDTYVRRHGVRSRSALTVG